MLEFNVVDYKDVYRDQILRVWENSVIATHHFLLPSDFNEIKKLVGSIDFNEFQFFCMTNTEDKVVGFIGIADQKIEMLFIEPSYFGQRLGSQLLDFAINKFQANKVDVNEQNSNALLFYQKFGFQVFDRTEQDQQGRNYPVLKMKL